MRILLVLFILATGIFTFIAPAQQAATPNTIDPVAVLSFTNLSAFLTSARSISETQTVRVSGTVAYEYENRSIFIQDENAGLLITTFIVQNIHPGDRVEVMGRVNNEGYSPWIREGTFKKLGAGPLPLPTVVTADDLRTGKYDMRLVQVDGFLEREANRRGDFIRLQIDSDGVFFNLDLRQGLTGNQLDDLQAGCRVRLVGICSVGKESHGRVDAFRILARNAGDITVVKAAPFFTRSHALILLGTISFLSLLFFAWVMALRFQVKKQTTHIKGMNENLEKLVELRTQELRKAIDELETFSYSVSHDLKAPLRAIQSFAVILQEDHSAELTPEASRLLSIIHDRSHRMALLIDDLLAFARLSRVPLHHAEVNMNLLATECFDEACLPEQNPKVEFVLHDLPPASADESMVRQVFLNLYSNSIKFRKHNAKSWIETGFIRLHGQTVYFVSDNGIGFNMKSSGKLFEVFERLTTEFEGTGVGLAIVQQIIKRHGGSVSAYGEPGNGSTFYFSLAPVKEFASVTGTFGPTRLRGDMS